MQSMCDHPWSHMLCMCDHPWSHMRSMCDPLWSHMHTMSEHPWSHQLFASELPWPRQLRAYGSTGFPCRNLRGPARKNHKVLPELCPELLPSPPLSGCFDIAWYGRLRLGASLRQCGGRGMADFGSPPLSGIGRCPPLALIPLVLPGGGVSSGCVLGEVLRESATAVLSRQAAPALHSAIQ